MRLLVLDVGVGVLLLATIAVAARARRSRALSPQLRLCSWILVAVPLPIAVGVHMVGGLSTAADQALFLASAAAFAVGAVLILGDEEEDWRGTDGDESPPWWPAFERELRTWELERRRRPVRT